MHQLDMAREVLVSELPEGLAHLCSLCDPGPRTAPGTGWMHALPLLSDKLMER